jgi:hypothetical protein
LERTMVRLIIRVAFFLLVIPADCKPASNHFSVLWIPCNSITE